MSYYGLRKRYLIPCLLLLLGWCLVPFQRNRASAPAEVYGSVPKGLTLEGAVTGIEEGLKIVEYNREQGYFLLNKSVIYVSPVPKESLYELTRALSTDDRLGVSILRNLNVITYGDLSKRGKVAKQLVAADKLIGGVVLARHDWIKDVKLPDKYKPARPEGTFINTVIYANFTNIAFEKKVRVDPKTKQSQVYYKRSDFTFDLKLIPISDKKARDGGFLPDAEKIEAGIQQPEFRANLAHMLKHREKYLAMDALDTALRHAEAAAFLRYLKNAKVKFEDLQKLFR